ncbi:MAG: hypothetical protein U0794_07820 [Isosphaeraceae bacterium]
MIALITGGHDPDRGVPGLAKTRAVRVLERLDLPSAAFNSTPDLLPPT